MRYLCSELHRFTGLVTERHKLSLTSLWSTSMRLNLSELVRPHEACLVASLTTAIAESVPVKLPHP